MTDNSAKLCVFSHSPTPLWAECPDLDLIVLNMNIECWIFTVTVTFSKIILHEQNCTEMKLNVFKFIWMWPTLNSAELCCRLNVYLWCHANITVRLMHFTMWANSLTFIHIFSIHGVKSKMLPHLTSHMIWCYDVHSAQLTLLLFSILC